MAATVQALVGEDLSRKGMRILGRLFYGGNQRADLADMQANKCEHGSNTMRTKDCFEVMRQSKKGFSSSKAAYLVCNCVYVKHGDHASASFPPSEGCTMRSCVRRFLYPAKKSLKGNTETLLTLGAR